MDNKTLKQAGFKITSARLKILHILEKSTARHLSVEEVYQLLRQAGENIGIATVYRVLTQFANAGLVKKRQFENDYAVFEIEHGEHHDHIVCVHCGQVDEFIDKIIEQQQKKIVAKMGYQMTDHNLTIYGVCKNCITKHRKQA